MTNKIKFLVSLLLLIILSLGCNSNTVTNTEKFISNNTNFSKKINSTANRDKLPMANGNGISLGLYDENGKIEKDINFNLNNGHIFEKFISITNSNTPRNYKLLLFIDYNQSNFKVDGKDFESFNFKMNPQETLEIPVELEPLSSGLHDILFVIVKYPDIKSLDEDFRKQTDMNHLLFLRYTITVDNEKIPDYNLYKTKILDRNLLDGVFINLEEDELKRWLYQDVNPSSDLNYYIHVGNNSNIKNKKYALLVLNDWKQVPITKDINKLFFEVESGKELVVPARLKVPKEKGIYDLTPILIHNPYELLNYTNKNCETAIRVGLNVK